MALAPNLLATYHNLMDNINYGLIVIDENLKISMTNKWVQEHCKHLLNQETNDNIYQVFPDLENSRISDAIGNVFEFGYPSIISNIFTPTPFPLYTPKNFEESLRKNERIQQQITIARLKEADTFYCLIQINDVTAAVSRERTLEQEVLERKEIEDALLEADTKHTTIMDKMIDGLIVFSEGGQIESFNPACETLFGYLAPEVLGLCVSKLFVDLTKDLQVSAKDTLSIDPQFIGSYQDIVAKRSDGFEFDVELSISEMCIRDKIFYTGIIRDITERKNIDKMKTEFISTVSHELRTPLTSIRGSLGLINGGVIDLASEKATDLIQIAYNNCDRLILLINDILDMEKLAAGEMAFEIRSHDISVLVENSIKDNQAYADHYKVSYQYANTKEYPANVDQHRFMQVMANLLSNAAKFSKENSVVDISISHSENTIVVAVRDYGEGISAEFQDNIWRKFTQADASTTRKKGGTGLGLAISRSLVETMKGSIRFESKKDEGTTFIVNFPMSA